jgi:hypothetical protein
MPLRNSGLVTSALSGGEVEQLATPSVAATANAERDTDDKTIENPPRCACYRMMDAPDARDVNGTDQRYHSLSYESTPDPGINLSLQAVCFDIVDHLARRWRGSSHRAAAGLVPALTAVSTRCIATL